MGSLYYVNFYVGCIMDEFVVGLSGILMVEKVSYLFWYDNWVLMYVVVCVVIFECGCEIRECVSVLIVN